MNTARAQNHHATRPASKPGLPCRWLLPVASFALLMVFSRIALAQPAASAFDDANRLYAQGKFAEAAATYEQLVSSGKTSPALYFNLGNAFFKAGRMGRAIAAYRNADRLAPRDPDVLANLRFARNRVQGLTLAPPAWHRALERLSLNEWTVATFAAVWALLLLLAAGQLRPQLRPALKASAISAAVIASFLGTCFAAAWQVSRTPLAIVIAPEAIVHQAPLVESGNVLIAHDGAEFRLLDRKDNWYQVSPNQNRIGWVRRDQVLLLNAK